jgi:D-3-phosphoglycerate dehydrogenase
VYGTHHCGASTDQAQFAVAEEVVRIVKVYRNSGKFENQVN